MPTYIRRALQEYPTEFYRSSLNPEGYAFACPFCSYPTFYKTKCAYISHMKKCCREEDIEYTDELEIEDGITIYDHHRNHASKSKTIQEFLSSHALASLTDLPLDTILERIQAKLVENGFNSKDMYLYTTSFSIYEFFFQASQEETSDFRRRCAEHIYSEIQEHLQTGVSLEHVP